jgi:glycerophosphoryl diester phosphodiesterase
MRDATGRGHRFALGGLLAIALLGAGGAHAFDLQGHRGARGLAPENTLPAFRKALALGVDTLECDMAITRDGVVVIHHDLRLNPDTTRGPDGQWLDKPGPAISELTFEELQRYDVGRLKPGSRYAAAFADQVPVDGTRIPRLADLFDLVKRSGNAKIGFDCETKVSPLERAATLPPDEFTRRVVTEVRKAGMQDRLMIQSFDWSTLQLVQKEAPEIRTMYLSTPQTLEPTRDGKPSPWLAGFAPERHGGSVPKAVSAAGGKIWAPNESFLTPEMLAEAHAMGIVVIPWTVNDPATVARLLRMGVDGIISDRPDLVQAELAKAGTLGSGAPAAESARAEAPTRDGSYLGQLCNQMPNAAPFCWPVALVVRGGVAEGGWISATRRSAVARGTVTPDGQMELRLQTWAANDSPVEAVLVGRAADGAIAGSGEWSVGGKVAGEWKRAQGGPGDQTVRP